MKKRIFAAALAALLVVLLTACLPQTDSDQDITAQQVPPETTAEPTRSDPTVAQPETTVEPVFQDAPTGSTQGAQETIQPAAAIAQLQATAAPVSQDDPVRSAFQRALQTIHDELYWPEVPYDEKIELWEPGTIEDEQFAIVDVDGDGEEELLVSVFNTYTAGMCEIIYDYDPQTDGVRVEAQNYVAVTHYPGMLKVDASHNHGYAGEILWPYVVMRYDESEDAYKEAFMVDAWCKAIADYDPYAGMPYPEDVDTEHDGYVYLITENGQKRILNRADYQKWEAEVFSQKEPLTIPWQKMTATNIGSLDLN